ncbi:MAG: hypothetical protein Q9168_007057 [Polycauliona sp. 1 TL-2023]
MWSLQSWAPFVWDSGVQSTDFTIDELEALVQEQGDREDDEAKINAPYTPTDMAVPLEPLPKGPRYTTPTFRLTFFAVPVPELVGNQRWQGQQACPEHGEPSAPAYTPNVQDTHWPIRTVPAPTLTAAELEVFEHANMAFFSVTLVDGVQAMGQSALNQVSNHFMSLPSPPLIRSLTLGTGSTNTSSDDMDTEASSAWKDLHFVNVATHMARFPSDDGRIDTINLFVHLQMISSGVHLWRNLLRETIKKIPNGKNVKDIQSSSTFNNLWNEKDNPCLSRHYKMKDDDAIDIEESMELYYTKKEKTMIFNLWQHLINKIQAIKNIGSEDYTVAKIMHLIIEGLEAKDMRETMEYYSNISTITILVNLEPVAAVNKPPLPSEFGVSRPNTDFFITLDKPDKRVMVNSVYWNKLEEDLPELFEPIILLCKILRADPYYRPPSSQQ